MGYERYVLSCDHCSRDVEHLIALERPASPLCSPSALPPLAPGNTDRSWTKSGRGVGREERKKREMERERDRGGSGGREKKEYMDFHGAVPLGF